MVSEPIDTSAERRLFPIQRSYHYKKPHPLLIPWSVAEKAYSVYSARYGTKQSLKRLAERGGFGPEEMDTFHPTWQEEASEIAALRAERDALRAQMTALEAENAELRVTASQFERLNNAAQEAFNQTFKRAEQAEAQVTALREENQELRRAALLARLDEQADLRRIHEG